MLNGAHTDAHIFMI